MLEINLLKQVWEEVKYDFNVLSKIFHKRIFCFTRHAGSVHKKQTNFFLNM